MLINFEGLTGTQHESAYSAQGITFVGGTLRHNTAGTYLEGYTQLIFNPAEVSPLVISFRGDGAGLDNLLWVWAGAQRYETQLFEQGSYSPHTESGFAANWYPGQTFSGRISSDKPISRVEFTTIALDDIEFGAPLVAAEISIASPLALVLLGLAAIAFARRFAR